MRTATAWPAGLELNPSGKLDCTSSGAAYNQVVRQWSLWLRQTLESRHPLRGEALNTWRHYSSWERRPSSFGASVMSLHNCDHAATCILDEGPNVLKKFKACESLYELQAHRLGRLTHTFWRASWRGRSCRNTYRTHRL